MLKLCSALFNDNFLSILGIEPVGGTPTKVFNVCGYQIECYFAVVIFGQVLTN